MKYHQYTLIYMPNNLQSPNNTEEAHVRQNDGNDNSTENSTNIGEETSQAKDEEVS